jgi:glucose-1-phosphate thymidylyltransferase
MNLLVLGAGYALRLYPLTRNTAKPLIDVAGKPMIEHVIAAMSGIDDIEKTVLISNDRFAADYDRWLSAFAAPRPALHPVLLNDGSTSPDDQIGAIGDLHLALGRGNLYDDDLIVVGGDNLFSDCQLPFVEFARDKPASIATFDVGSPEIVKRFASLESDGDGRITAFVEKPSSPTTTIAGTAFYFFQKDTLPLIDRYIADGNNPDNAGYLFQWLYPRIPTFAHSVAGRWFDVGTESALAEARQVFAACEAP